MQIKPLIAILILSLLLTMGSIPVISAETYQYVRTFGMQGTEQGQFINPTGLSTDSSGNIYIADWGNNRIQKLTGDSQLTTIVDSGLLMPTDVAANSQGAFYVADSGSVDDNFVSMYRETGDFMLGWGRTGIQEGEFVGPLFGISLNASGFVYVTDLMNRTQIFNGTGQFISQWGSTGSENGQFRTPGGVAIDSAGNVFVADISNNRVQKFTSTGEFIFSYTGSGDTQLKGPNGVAVDSSGNVFIADTGNNRIQKVTNTFEYITQWGTFGSEVYQFNRPTDVIVANSGFVYVCDSGNNRILEFKQYYPPPDYLVWVYVGFGIFVLTLASWIVALRLRRRHPRT